MTKEALKLALEALDNDSDSDAAWHQRLDAKIAIKQALAAPVQEPVAKIVPCHTPSGKRVALNTEYQHLPIGTDLYTTPPAAQPAPVQEPSPISLITDKEWAALNEISKA
jgi:hypothetical protein